MEGVPRLPMLSWELKESPSNTEFGPTLKKYIRNHYHEDPESYKKEIKDLESLRQSACKVPHDFTGCTKLKQYYSQLHCLQSRFPMTDEGPACVLFMWSDIYSGMVFSITDIKYEQACILYNIGALHSELGATDSRISAEGMKIACTHFQCASWAFQHLREHYPQPKGSDMSHDLLTFFINVMLAQAQECILEKSMLDSRKSSITAKVASQVVEYYQTAVTTLLAGSNSMEAGSILVTVGAKLFMTWKKFVEFKISYYRSISNLYMGNQAEEQQKMGDRLAWFQLALDKLNEAIKISKNMERDDLNETLTFTMDVIGNKHSIAKKENDFVYHEKVPPLESLPEVKGASLVKGIPFSTTDPDVCGVDIFSRLVPIEAHEASSLYSEEKAKLLRSIAAKVEDKDQELTTYLSSLQLDPNLLNPQTDKIPQELLEKCAAMSVRQNAVGDVMSVLNDLLEISEEVEGSLKQTQELLKQDEQKELLHQDSFGKRAPSIIVVELSKECSKYQEAHKRAIESNSTLQKALNLHVDNLQLLGGTLENLKKALPSISLMDAPNDNDGVVQELKHLLDKVEEMKSQRQMLESQLRDALQNDDITKQLVMQENKENLESFFQDELRKHNPKVNLLEQNLTAQDSILHALTQANARYADIKKSAMEILNRREAMIMSLINSFDAYEDLLAKAQQGLDFYRKLQANVSRLSTRVRSVTKVQDEERSQIGEAQARKGRTVDLPISVASTATPKLKDFLPYCNRLKDSTSVGFAHQPSVPVQPEISSSLPQTGLQYPIASTTVYSNVLPESTVSSKIASQPSFHEQIAGTYHSNSPEVAAIGVRPTPVGSEQTTTAQCTSTTYASSYTVNSINKPITADGGYNQQQDLPYNQYAYQYYQQYLGQTNSSPSIHPVENSLYNQQQSGISTQNLYNQNNQYTYSQTSASQSNQYTKDITSQHQFSSSNDVTNYPVSNTSNYSQNYSASNISSQNAVTLSSYSQVPSSYMYNYSSPQVTTSVNYSYPYNQSITAVTTTSGVQQYAYGNINSQYSSAQYGKTSQSQYGGQQLQQNQISSSNLGYQNYYQSAESANQPSINQMASTYCYTSLPQMSSSVGQYSQEQHINNYYSSYLNSQSATGYSQQGSVLQSNISQHGLQYSQQSAVDQPTMQYVQQPVSSHQTSITQPSLQYTQPIPTQPSSATQPPIQYAEQPVPLQPSKGATQPSVQYTQQPVPSQISGATQPSVQHTQQTVPLQSTTALPSVQYTQQSVSSQQTNLNQYQYPQVISQQTGVSQTSVQYPEQPVLSQYNVQYPQHSQSQDIQFQQGQAMMNQDSSLQNTSKASNTFHSEPIPIVSSRSHSQSSSITEKKTSTDILSSTPEDKLSTKQQLPILKPKVMSSLELLSKKDTAEQERAQAKDPLSDTSILEKFISEVEKFEKFVEGLTRKSLLGPTALDQKWKELMDNQDRESRKMSISVARCYPIKNRYPDIMPYDGNRVVINSLRNDYINASFIKDITPNSISFIVTQAPLPSAYLDFWTMLWEQQTEIIVCLLGSSELKSQIYWPTERGQQMSHGHFTLGLQSIKEKQTYMESILSITHNESRISRVVIHLQFTAFPASGVPASPSHLLLFVAEVHNYHRQQRNLARPVVVHCSGGVGRSGVFCLLSSAIKEMGTGRGPFDVAQIAARMSQQRKCLIQEKDHLKFCYDAALYHAQDILMKRGILTNKAKFEDKLPTTQHTHIRHPSADFILGAEGVAKLQSGMAKLEVRDKSENKDSKEDGLETRSEKITTSDTSSVVSENETASDTGIAEDTTKRPNENETDLISSAAIDIPAAKDKACTDKTSASSSPSITSLLDPATFTLDTSSSGKKRITKDNFTNRSSSLDHHDPDDPLSQLDPLWSLKKT